MSKHNSLANIDLPYQRTNPGRSNYTALVQLRSNIDIYSKT